MNGFNGMDLLAVVSILGAAAVLWRDPRGLRGLRNRVAKLPDRDAARLYAELGERLERRAARR